MAKWYSIVLIYHILFSHSSVDGYLRHFHPFAVVQSPGFNQEVHYNVAEDHPGMGSPDLSPGRLTMLQESPRHTGTS